MSNARGEITVTFAMEITLLNQDNEQFLQAVKDSGSIQLQYVFNGAINSASRDKLKIDDWSLSQSSPTELIFKVEYNEPGLVSSSGFARDNMNIIFVDTSQFIRCEKIVADDPEEQPTELEDDS